MSGRAPDSDKEEHMEFLTTTVDKFTFRVPTDRLFTPEGIWFQATTEDQPNRRHIGLTDFLQQHSGDLTFALIRPEGTLLTIGAEIGTIETVKANLSLTSPVAGTIVNVNPDLELTPELINQDPYEKGWLAVIEVAADDLLASRLMSPIAYFDHMKGLAEAEVRSR
jgi:glycine cleavage system H protein